MYIDMFQLYCDKIKKNVCWLKRVELKGQKIWRNKERKIPLIICLHHSLHPKFADPTKVLCVTEVVDLVFLLMNLLSMVLLKH